MTYVQFQALTFQEGPEVI